MKPTPFTTLEEAVGWCWEMRATVMFGAALVRVEWIEDGIWSEHGPTLLEAVNRARGAVREGDDG